MRRPAFLKRPGLWLLALGLAVLVLGPGSGWGETLTVSQPNQSLYPAPDFASTPIAPVPAGSQVSVVSQSGDWYQVNFQGKTGWLPRQAFPAAKGAKFNLPSVLFGGPVKETKSDEVALAGKGFTPEVESSYRQAHPEMKFAEVDQVEAFRVDGTKLQAFIREGGLNP